MDTPKTANPAATFRLALVCNAKKSTPSNIAENAMKTNKTIYLPPVSPTIWQEAAKRFDSTLNRRQALLIRGIELLKQEVL
jgi:hypothetical protein